MGLWDSLKGLVQKSSEEAGKQAAKAAAKQALQSATDQVGKAGDEFLDFAEKELKEAEGKREGGDDWRPKDSSADAIADSILSAAEDAESGPSDDTDTEDPKAKAAAELARLKAELRAGRIDE